MLLRRFLIIIITLAIFIAPVNAQAAPPQQAVGSKLVLAFYYPWYSSSDFDKGQMLDRPVAPYDSNQPETTDLALGLGRIYARAAHSSR